MCTWIQRPHFASVPVQRKQNLNTVASHLEVSDADMLYIGDRRMPIISITQSPYYGLPPAYGPRLSEKDEPQTSVWTMLFWQLGLVARQLFRYKLDIIRYSIIRNAFPNLFSPAVRRKRLVVFLVLLFLPVVSALDNEVTLSPSHGSASRAVAWISLYSLIRILAGCFIALVIMIGGHLGGVVKVLMGPLMGFTSVLWMTMRSDSAVRPEFSWM